MGQTRGQPKNLKLRILGNVVAIDNFEKLFLLKMFLEYLKVTHIHKVYVPRKDLRRS